ncbi:MAG: glycerol-3-phosphate 1-O-acyltransferase PlsY [Pseudomonadota bacterium]
MPHNLIFIPILAYFMGSIPFGLVLTRLFSKVNIRGNGSGNIGATNVARLAGVRLGVITLIGDVLKGFIPVYLAIWLVGQADCVSAPTWKREAYVSLVALAAFFGHQFSVFLKLEGGKGVATGAGCMAVIAPLPLALSLLVFGLTACFSKYVSVGSLSGSLLLPFTIWAFMDSKVYLMLSIIIAMFILYQFRENIHRLRSGTELGI